MATVDYVVLLHAVCTAEPWLMRLKIVRIPERTTVGERADHLDIKNAAVDITRLLGATIGHLTAALNLPRARPDGDLAPPAAAQLPTYLIALEQSLAIACAPLVGDKPFLSQERALFDNLLQLAVAAPANKAARLLLLAACEREARRRPDIVSEYRERLERLQREYPLQGPVQAIAVHSVESIVARLTQSA